MAINSSTSGASLRAHSPLERRVSIAVSNAELGEGGQAARVGVAQEIDQEIEEIKRYEV
jgi:hypothetical protein